MVYIVYGEFQLYLKDVDTGALTVVSADASGVPGNGFSGLPAVYDITAEGRYVAFGSQATNLVPGDSNGFSDVFVKDARTGAVTLISTDEKGGQGTADSLGPSISDDGRFVAFASSASNFIPPGAGLPRQFSVTTDIYVKDLQTGTLLLASSDPSGHQGTGPESAYFGASFGPSLTADGHKVAFSSNATNFVPNDTNDQPDIFLKDLRTGEIALVSTDDADHQANNSSGSASISADGRYVAFSSFATNLVPGDTSGTNDVFVKDMQTGAVTLVSGSLQGTPGNGFSGSPSISPNGRFVSFNSEVPNLVFGDSNGSSDIFVKDLTTGKTTLVSVGLGGSPANRSSGDSDVTDAGDVVFASAATNLVSGGTNNQVDIFLWA